MTQDSSKGYEPSQLGKATGWDLAVLAGSFGLVAGIGVGAVALDRGIPKAIAVAGAAAGLGSGITYLVTDDRHTRRRNELNRQIDGIRAERNEMERQRTQLHQEVQQVKQAIARLNQAAHEKQLQLQVEIEQLTSAFQQAQADALTNASKVNELAANKSHLQRQIDQLQHERTEAVEKLKTLVEAMHAEIAEQVDREAAARLHRLRQQEIQAVAQQYESLATQLFGLFAQLENWGAKVKEGHEAKASLIRGLAGEYNGEITELKSSVANQTSAYLAQIELLNEKLARAYAENRGELLEPKKGQFGYSREGAIANEIAGWVFAKLGIPLAVGNFHLRENGVAEAGYLYAASANGAAIVEAIGNAREVCARNLGIYKIESVRKLEVVNHAIVVSFRCDRPTARASKGSLYRSKEDLLKFLLSSRLFFRFVGSPGSGKTPTVMVILSHLLKQGFLSGNVATGKKLDYTLIEFCNPLEGISVKNGDETALFHRWSDPKQAIKALKAEYEFRKDPTNATYKNQVGYVWVCDEFNNAVAGMKSEELKAFMKTLRDGGHLNMGAIVIGQEVMVSKAVALTIEDQKFFTNVLLDPVSIRTFLQDYGSKFYAENAVKVALATLEAIEAEIEETNESICDTARQLRVAMVVADRSPVFYQLPYFDSAEIDTKAYEDTRSQIAAIRAGRDPSPAASATAATQVESTFPSVYDAAGRLPMSAAETEGCRPCCPHCGSNKVRSKGNQWLCEDTAHSQRAPGKPKSWKKL